MGETATLRELAIDQLLRVARTSVVTLAVGGLGWSFAMPSELAGSAGAAERRSAPVARAAVVSKGVPVHVQIDGLRLATSARSDQDAATVLAGLGVALQPTDRLSVAPTTLVVAGMRIVLDRGLPVTLVVGGVPADTRAPRGTVEELLAARGIALGPHDKLSVAAGTLLQPGSVVQVTRIDDREVTEHVPVPFTVRTVPAADLYVGQHIVVTSGAPGEAERVWRVRYVDGAESARTLLSDVQVREPVAEVRRVGTRVRPIPPAPAEIEQIIRDAAERWGADPEQLLRVAWCESRYDPLAFNPGASDSGLFQFIPRTWAYNSPRAGYAGASPFDPVAAANTAAMLFAEGKAYLWVCK